MVETHVVYDVIFSNMAGPMRRQDAASTFERFMIFLFVFPYEVESGA